jgi:ketosteroid isomerase-like protein
MWVEGAAVAAERAFFGALIEADIEALERILADDFILIDVLNGSEVDKPALLELIESGRLKLDAIEATDSRVRLYKTTAVVTGRTQMKGRSRGRSFRTTSRYTHVYVEQGRKWRLVACQGTPIR